MKPAAHFVSLLFLILAQIMVSSNIVGSKYLISYFTPGLILAVRYIPAAAILFICYLLFEHKKTPKDFIKIEDITKTQWIFMLAQGLCAGILFNFLLYIGMQYTSASMGGIITSALPAIIVLLSFIIFKEKITRKNILCILLTVTGLIVINLKNLGGTSFYHWLGDLLILLSLLPEASYYLLIKIQRIQLPIFLYTTILTACNIPFILLWLALQKHSYLHLQHLSMNIVITSIIVSLTSGLFFLFWIKAAKTLPILLQQ